MQLLKTKYFSLYAPPLLLVLCFFALPGQKVFAASTYTVTNTNDSGAGSLRQAIDDANGHTNSGGNDLISFNIAGSGVHTITPDTDLPEITDGVTIDGSTQSGASCSTHTLKIEINGGNLTYGLHLGAGSSDSIVRGFVINRVGTGDVGVASFSELQAQALSGEVGSLGDGGPPPGAVHIDSSSANNHVTCNLIGTNATGDTAVPNVAGIVLSSVGSGNVIGGTTVSDRNIVSSNLFSVVSYFADGVLIEGNYIGPNLDGTQALAGTVYGVYLAGGANNVVGGTSTGARNVISGNGLNIADVATTDSEIKGNYIGTNASGDSGFSGLGIASVNGAENGSVHTTGDDELLPNTGGILSSNTTTEVVGGTEPGAGNVISGNLYNIQVNNGQLTAKGNYIGTNAAGTACLEGTYYGISANRMYLSTIGGATPAARNIISCARQDNDDQYGVGIYMNSSEINKIQGNYIGTNANGEVESGFGNEAEGVVERSASNKEFNQVGGVNDGEGNIIAGNGGTGVKVLADEAGQATIHHPILGNSIYDNGGIGIDLLEEDGDGFISAGVTANDAGDADTGPNDYMNFPVITNVTSSSGEATITYNLDINDAETGATGYRVEFFANDSADGSGNGEGQTYLGYDTVAGDVTGETANITLPNGVDGEKYITATATMTGDLTDANDGSQTYGSTSEYSAIFQATLVNPNSDSDQDNISSDTENAAPNNGDANNDGTLDAEQDNVASFVDPVTGEYAVLQVSDECSITSVSIAEESSSHADPDFSYPTGLMDFTLDCGTPGTTATVTQYYYGVTGNLIVRKYNPTTKTYTTIDSASISNQTIGGQQAKVTTYQVKDGGSLDLDGAEDGNIHDPAGLAQTTDTLADTGQNTNPLILLSSILLTSGLVIASNTYKQQKRHTHATSKN